MRGAAVHPAAAAPSVRYWLWFAAFLVALMVVVGGATRLTDSGLSITEWQPIMGAIPPLTAADWHDAFEKYKQIPEYKIVNAGMTLEAFKTIFWWEWGHRFLGRLVGVVFAVPLVVFALRGLIPAGYGRRLLFILVLGGLQGAMGWYMVKSGLVDLVDVSQYRLAAHLGLAIVILGFLVWTALDLAPEVGQTVSLRTVSGCQRRLAYALLALVFVQIVAGALVAGLKAGLLFNTWPLMNGELVPTGMLAMEPAYLNIFENTATVQFNHRLLAYVVTGLTAWHAWSLLGTADEPRVRHSAVLLLVAVLAQVGIGVWTLLAQVPISLGLAHQAGAVVVFGLAVRHLWLVRRATW